MSQRQKPIETNLNQIIIWYNQRIKIMHKQIKTMLELNDFLNKKDQIEINESIKESQIMIQKMILQRNILIKFTN